MGKSLERLEEVVRGELPPPPVAKLIGFRLTSIKPGEAIVELETNESHANPLGTLHGGILCDIADATMGLCFASTLEDDESFTTIELKINFLRPTLPASHEKLRAIGRIVKRGRTVGLTECDVLNSAGDLVARASSTCMVLRGEPARTR
jgi:uncharacterized protein (TIGR00369 family)